MGFDIETWNDIAGAMFMGWGSSATGIWTLISVVCCVFPCFSRVIPAGQSDMQG